MTPLAPDENLENRNGIPALSVALRRVEQVLPQDEDLTVGQVLHFLGVHGIVFLLLILSLLNIVIFMLPGFSIFFGLPMAILAAQLVWGGGSPVFPSFIRDHKVRGASIHMGLTLAVTALERLERGVRPRIPVLTKGEWALRAHGFVALLLGLMVAIPLPFFNLPPTFGMICLSLGLLQRDGYFLIGSYFLAGWSLWLYESLHAAAQHFF